jgi:4-amino-4-deoxy-L-arabinose transferase-like glycosyltransferase
MGDVNSMMLAVQESAAIHADDAQPGSPARVSALEPFSRKSTFLILVAALLVNAVIVLMVAPKVRSPLALTYSVSFGDLYDQIARNLYQGNGYRVDPTMGNTMLREPGYPLLLAAVFKLGGYGMQPARLVCVLLAFGAALFLVRLTRKITGDAMIALAAALLFLLYPGTLVAEARAGIEIPSIFTVLLFVLVLYGAVENKSLRRYWAAGLLLGAAVLVRSEVLLFPLVLLGYFLLAARGWVERRKVVERIAVLVLGAVVVVSPWIIRNYVLAHEFVPTATVAGVAAQEGLYTCENATAAEPFWKAQMNAGFEREKLATHLGKPFLGPYYQLFYTPQDEVAFNHALLNHVSAEYRSHPALLAGCAAKNVLFNFWFLGKTRQSVLLNMIVQAPLLGLAIGGTVVLWRRGFLSKAAVILLYILYIPVVHAPIIAHARHSMLIIPFLAILAAVAIVSAWRALRVRKSGAPFQQIVAPSSGE